MPREEIKDSTGKITITLDGDTGEALVGATLVDGSGRPGIVGVQNQAGRATAGLSGENGLGASVLELRNGTLRNGVVLDPSAPPLGAIVSIRDEKTREI